MNNRFQTKIAEKLLAIEAFHFNLEVPYKWSSGWRSPVYCDTRLVLSDPATRTLIADEFTNRIRSHFPQTNLIAGVATGAIAHAALVAERMQLPMIYVRAAEKGHGLQNKIEGRYTAGSHCIVIEDVISTGESAGRAVAALQAAGLIVLQVLCIYNYDFPQSVNYFKEKNISVNSLTNFDTLLTLAENNGNLTAQAVAIVRQWQQDPQAYTQITDVP
jgi:orotate phosphoribosyltransferase